MTQNAKGPAEAATSPDHGSKFLEGIPMNGNNHNTDAAAAPALSRRRFMAIATASTAATLPAVALAEASGKTSRLPQLTLEQQFEICVANLKNVLAAMYPDAIEISAGFWGGSRNDGSFRFAVQGNRLFQSYDGPGLYEISEDGYLMTFVLEQDCDCSPKTGEPIPGMEFFWATLWSDGKPLDNTRRMLSPRIVRKLGEVPA